jgi:hypothetical protein
LAFTIRHYYIDEYFTSEETEVQIG